MGDTWVTDITYLPRPDKLLPDIYAPARRLAVYFGAIVAAASVALPDEVVETGLRCRQRPGRRPCPGSIDLQRSDELGGIARPPPTASPSTTSCTRAKTGVDCGSKEE